jgi:hypothetical protein
MSGLITYVGMCVATIFNKGLGRIKISGVFIGGGVDRGVQGP